MIFGPRIENSNSGPIQATLPLRVEGTPEGPAERVVGLAPDSGWLAQAPSQAAQVQQSEVARQRRQPHPPERQQTREGAGTDQQQQRTSG